MFPWSFVCQGILGGLLAMLKEPVFWLIVFVIALQYQRVAKNNKRYFISKQDRLRHIIAETLLSLGAGLLGGFIGSILLIVTGISITNLGIEYLWILAIVLFLLNARFICFSYSGGIIALSYLLFGWPRVDVPQLMGLVAILHLVESILIMMTGWLFTQPIYTKNAKGELVGGFMLQKFWPIPIIALMLLPDQHVAGVINTPVWWPLIKSSLVQVKRDSVFTMIPVLAALGYGDIAITAMPQKKTRRAGLELFIYSGVLLVLAIISSYYGKVMWVAAIFAPVAHEALILRGQKQEFKGLPIFAKDSMGVKILDKVAGKRQGIFKTGDIILSIDGNAMINKAAFGQFLSEANFAGEDEKQIYAVELRRYGVKLRRKVKLKELLAVITVPDGYEEYFVLYQDFYGNLLKKIKRKLNR
jgi:hypothetical protein